MNLSNRIISTRLAQAFGLMVLLSLISSGIALFELKGRCGKQWKRLHSHAAD